MIRVIQRRLIIPRGDTGTFTVPALSPGQAGSVGVFTIFDPITKTRIFQKQVELQENVFNIEFSHGDTVNLQAGDYLWDIKFYKNPIFADNKVIDGEEIDSYYAAFQTPKCEIRETGDAFMSIEGAHADIEDINLILAATQAANAAKDAATEQADIAADKAEEAAQRLVELVAQIPTKISELEDDSGHYTKPASGIPASDLEDTYVKFDDYASISTAGVVKVGPGLTIASGILFPSTPDSYIQSANVPYFTVPVRSQHKSVFYGLAKAAGDTTQAQSDNAIGTYTSEAKAAIQSMLGVPSTSDIPTNVSQLTNDAGYLTQHQDISGKANIADLAAVATSGSYDDLQDKPTIPDVQINGSSIVDNGVANIPKASSSIYGVVKTNPTFGIGLIAGQLAVTTATTDQIKDGTGYFYTIGAGRQHESTFYGLSKAAGVDLAAEENITVGTYPDSAKTAIRNMLGAAAQSDIPEVPVQDVQINGSSIIENGIATIPIASYDQPGIVQIYSGLGLGFDIVNGMRALKISQAPENYIKGGTNWYNPITPSRQHMSVFYGLAKAAGFDEKDSALPVGQYTNNAKIAIQQMLDVPSTSEVTSEIATAIGSINSFDMAVVQALPTQDISTHTIYLVPKTGETNDVYDEYVYINGNWEMVGNTQVDLSNYVQKTDYATKDTTGVVRVRPAYGLIMDGDTIKIKMATSGDQIKTGSATYLPIVPGTQHESTFYGLAKAAGDTTQSQSDNEVGTYTTEAKAAIRSMIGAAASADISVQDVQVDGISIVSNGIAQLPIASANGNLGLIKINQDLGFQLTSAGQLQFVGPNDAQIKAGIIPARIITPYNQHKSVFYGLAKAAGDTTQSQSNNAVGTYTAEAKAAIQTMLGITDVLAAKLDAADAGLKVVRLI